MPKFSLLRPLRAIALSSLLAAPTLSIAAEKLDKATVQRAITTALDTCTAVIDGNDFNPSALRKLKFEINDKPTSPTIWFYPGDLETATVNKNAAPRAIYEQYDKFPGCVISMIKPNMKNLDLYKLVKATLKQRGWAHSLRDDTFTRGGSTFKLRRGSQRDLYTTFTLRAQS